ncbi:hypothetical protein XU18_4259 [Perkinsela sp. CCAP 1560/4]|nr:hypothetical protein XU18_4259 [Perkinsela sp. CCAP 1560/4]|eukprot:KNH04489.1 hypothetical protein XU18_4259 [Perkinsela sp. CCAP 1560/4]
MLTFLGKRLEAILATANPPCLDLKQSRQLYRDVLSLDVDCGDLYRWTISNPPTAMCAHFISSYVHRPEVLSSSEIFDVIKRFIPCEIIKLMLFITGHKKGRLTKNPVDHINEGHLHDILLQCAKRCMEIRPSLSFDEIATLLDPFDRLEIFTGRFGEQFLEELLQRAVYVLEEADITDIPKILPFIFKYQKQILSGNLQSYVEAISERVVDIVGTCETMADPHVVLSQTYHTAIIATMLAKQGWAHKQLFETFQFLMKKLVQIDHKVFGNNISTSNMHDCVFQQRTELERVYCL